MAAATEWGAGEWSRFDAQTIGHGHPDSMAAMLSKTEITCHFSSSPFQERELAQPGVREVMSSYGIQGVNTSTPITVYAYSAFRAENPLTWLGFLLPALAFGVKGLHQWYPSIPDATTDVDLNSFFVTPPHRL